ncbi:hypothetical protein FA95DRAFT_1568886 [Auriscalpium vulgare]|uniref:Uncharacterized protein n=1 Tax=Auriscalpium vulgare TaxID=40419 RepID=A0ACB8SBQ8_9AGAM|nr:hypothetical protein FA95DRAFT_1568886 [Auriscalpium vulgare]
MAARNPAALSEILGIPSSSVPSTPTAQPTPAPTPTLTAIEEGLVKQTTASQSVADYFKMKLLAKSGGGSGSVTPDGEGERRGLGAFRLRYAEEGDEDEEERPRMGLGAGSAFAGMFASASVKEVVSVDAEETPEARDEDAKRERKAAKDERRRAKDERRRLRAEAKAKALAEAADEVPATSLAPAVVEVEAKRGAGKTKTAGGDAEIAGENKSGRKRRKAVE